jgi:hypothetical protein
MRSLWIIAIAALLTLSLSAADPAGTWKGSMETQMGATDVTIVIQSGTPLTGKVKIAEYDAPIEKAKLDGNSISFEINIGPGKVTYDGKVAADEIKFTVTGTQGDKYSLICKRQK